MADINEKYDSVLLGVLQREGQISKFLDTIFGFLYRKTDFYLTMKDKTAKMGFPPGVSLKLTVGAFKKYEELTKLNEEKSNAARGLKQTAVVDASDKKGPQVEPKLQTKVATQDVSKPSKAELVASRDGNPEESRQPEKPVGAVGENTAPSPMQDQAKRNPGREHDEDDDQPELTEMQKQFQANAESYNGAVRDNYSWSQAIGDVDVRVNVPATVRKGADVKVNIEKKALKVTHKDANGQFVTCLQGDLCWEIVKDESMWTLFPGEHVHINLEKHQERWWDALLKNEPKISVRKIDPSRPITDLDGEAQAKIEEMMFNEHQKKIGKPQTHETKVHDMLKKAWDAEGSPFKGQPFDPSVVTVANQNQMGGLPNLPGT